MRGTRHLGPGPRLLIGPLSLIVACLVVSPGGASDQAPEQVKEFSAAIRPLLEKRCVECHGPKEQEGGVNFARIAGDEEALRKRSLWKRAARRVEAGEMPPEDAPHALEPSEKQQLVRWMRFASQYVDCSDPAQRDPGPPPFRRLTRTEYGNTVRDLLDLHVEIAGAVGIADDGGGEHFDNLAASLTLSSSLMDKYFAAADKIIEAVFAPDGNGERARRALFVVRPGKDLSDREAARQVIARFARRAYRRAPTDDDLKRLLRFHDQAAMKGESFEGAVRAALKPVLVSPRFLFRIEEDRPATGKALGVPISDDELAVRLSYFLWSTMPDDELFRLAEAKTLSDPAELSKQVRRMLAGPKARALTENFAAQWLQLRKLNQARPSTEFFPTFNGPLKQAMRDEVLTFCDKLREEDRSLLDLLDADYTYVNEPLAAHYGIPGVKGNEMRKVALQPENHRGGLLGMAGVLAMTSHTFRTSPTQRGKYVLEVVFGTPPPPPPPNVGTIKDDQPGAKTQARSFREQLAQHATQASCAGCHRKIDPLGFALDNYNAIGAWRESTPETPLDVSGVLPTGEKFAGIGGLKQVLRQRQDDFTRNVVETMLVYALGRELDHFDECSVREVQQALQSNGSKFSALVTELVKSAPFRQRRAE